MLWPRQHGKASKSLTTRHCPYASTLTLSAYHEQKNGKINSFPITLRIALLRDYFCCRRAFVMVTEEDVSEENPTKFRSQRQPTQRSLSAGFVAMRLTRRLLRTMIGFMSTSTCRRLSVQGRVLWRYASFRFPGVASFHDMRSPLM